MTALRIIAAMDKNMLIGNKGKMPWHLSADLVRFRKITMGHIVVMGRKTFESLGKALDGRRNIILSKNTAFKAEGYTVVSSVEECLKLCGNEETYIIGGAEVFRLFLPIADKLYLTRIEHEFEGDTYFPEYDGQNWKIVSEEEGIVTEKSPYPHRFAVYENLKLMELSS